MELIQPARSHTPARDCPTSLSPLHVSKVRPLSPGAGGRNIYSVKAIILYWVTAQLLALIISQGVTCQARSDLQPQDMFGHVLHLLEH